MSREGSGQSDGQPRTLPTAASRRPVGSISPARLPARALEAEAADRAFETFQEEGIVEHAAAMAPEFEGRLRELQARHPSIGDVRGLGCLWGLELVKNRETREPLVPFNPTAQELAPVTRMAKAALDRGLYLMTRWNIVMVCPPLNITTDELDEGIAILDEALAIADEYYEG